MSVHFHDGVFEPPTGHRTGPRSFVDGSPLTDFAGALGAHFVAGLALQGGLVLHAAALATDSGAALILGGSGSGKSTLSAAWLAAGRRILADDAVVLTRAPDDAVGAEPWRRNLSLRTDVAGHFSSALGARLHPRTDTLDRRYWLLRTDYPDLFVETASITDICFLASTPRPRVSELERVQQADGYARLCAQNPYLKGDFGTAVDGLRATTMRLLGNARCWRLRVGANLLHQPAAEVERITAWLTRLGN